MGTSEVYKEKLRTGNLYHDPTMNPGLGFPPLPPLSFPHKPQHGLAITFPSIPKFVDFHSIVQGKQEWTINSVLHDATAVAGSAAGAMLGAVHGFNTGIPLLQKHVRGPSWLHCFIELPPLLLSSGASAAFGDKILPVIRSFHSAANPYAVPKFAQLTVTSYYAASSAPHYATSQITSYVEAAHSSHDVHDKPR